MAIRDPKKQVDGFMNLLGGVDSNLNPNLLRSNQLAWAVNVSLRGGYAETRPGFFKQPILFDDAEMRDWCETHSMQGVGVYYGLRKTVVVFSSGGRIFAMDVLKDFSVTEITPVKTTVTTTEFITPPIGEVVPVDVGLADTGGIDTGTILFIGTGKYVVELRVGTAVRLRSLNTEPGRQVVAGSVASYLDPNPAYVPKTWMCQADVYLIIQNNHSLPIIYDGITARRALGFGTEVPTGSVMAYSQGRLWVAINESEFVAGDIVGGDSSVINFTENNRIAGGGKFQVPEVNGKITAMAVMSSIDTSMGQGPLQVCTERSIYSVNAPVTRDAWQTVESPIQTVSLINYGPTSSESVVLVNGDMFFRARDGIRSFIVAARDFTSWGNRAMSGEVDKVLRDDNETLLDRCSAVLFDNRLLTTVGPLRDIANQAIYHTGLVSLNFDPISAMAAQPNPVWEGLWTGINPYVLFAGTFEKTERCFAFCRSTNDQKLELWEITTDGNFDNRTDRIVSIIETASFSFRNLIELKKLHQCELWVDHVVGEVDFNLLYRSDQYPCWFDWPNDQQICSRFQDCSQELTGCLLSHTFEPAYRTRLRWGWPPEQSAGFDEKPTAHCYEAQLRMQWTGRARVKALILKAIEVEEEPHSGGLP